MRACARRRGDAQVVRLQEAPEDIPEGDTPHTVTLYAFEELVDVAKPGDRVEVPRATVEACRARAHARAHAAYDASWVLHMLRGC